jgi:hypothetical protein
MLKPDELRLYNSILFCGQGIPYPITDYQIPYSTIGTYLVAIGLFKVIHTDHGPAWDLMSPTEIVNRRLALDKSI